MARLVERRDSAEVTVTVRHVCPIFTFGSALGPRNLVSYWWLERWDDPHIEILDAAAATHAEHLAVERAIERTVGALNYRTHLDELAELP